MSDETVSTAASVSSIEVRRNVSLAAVVGGLAAILTIAFAVRAFSGGSGLDWLCFGVLAAVSIVHFVSLADSRAPLLVADEHGVRLRQGAVWRGIAWPEIDCLEHLPRRGLLKDGHILVDGYDDQQLVVPLTLASRVVGAEGRSLSDALAELADDRADVVEVVPGMVEETERATSVPKLSDLYGDDASEAPVVKHGIAARVAAGLSGLSGDRDAVADPEAAEDLVAAYEDHEDTGEIDPAAVETYEEIEAERPTVLSARVDFDRPVTERLTPLDAPADVPAGSETMTIVLDDLAVRPAAAPIVGPQLSAARDRLRLTIDQLSERTRIRPHVIEAIEVDDFSPCGGDFYARGHLRTLSRVLGIEAGPLVAAYDDNYADAPVDPRRVFEAELATGTGGSIRSTRGGRNWSVMIAAVMGAVLIWSVAKLVMGGPAPIGDTPVLNQSGGVSKAAAAKGEPVKLTLVAAGGGAQLVIRDAAGDIVFDGNLAFGQTSVLKLVPPARIWTSDGSVTYAIGKAQQKALGETGAEVSKTVTGR